MAQDPKKPLSDIEIARQAKMQRIEAIAEKAGIPDAAFEPYGKHIAKVDLAAIEGLASRPDGKLILVTAINPTPAGEGKTTTTVGLGDGLNRIGKKTMICLREPSLGPCFGVKGGAAGGGYAQIVPMEQINLHFTGDFHAITSAHNLLSAMIDNHIYWGNSLGIDTRRVAWRRVLDMNDRSLRSINSSLGGVSNGFPREDGFDITVASEVMAVFCLAKDLADLEARLGKMIVAYTRDKKAITAADIKAANAMTVLLKDATKPNLVQTLEGNPAFVHGGPFANIAHGCNSVIATRAGLKLADYVVTEAGFGADLGAEKFFDIKCRKAGLTPAAAVIVATVRALKMHGGVPKDQLGKENLEALRKGLANLGRHVENVRKFGVPAIVAINYFTADTAAEHDLHQDLLQGAVRRHRRGLLALGRGLEGHRGAGAPRRRARRGPASARRPRLPPSLPGRDAALGQDEDHRQGDLPGLRHHRRPEGARPVPRHRGGRLRQPADLRGEDPVLLLDRPEPARRAGRSCRADSRGPPVGRAPGFLVVVCGEIMTMPGLPKVPSAEFIRLDANGQIDGLF